MQKITGQIEEISKHKADSFSEALVRGLAVINAFGSVHPAMTLSEVAAKLALPRATVRRTLLTLVHLGYMRLEGRLFSLRPSILRLATAYLGADPVSTVMQPVCEELSMKLGVTCSVAVLDGQEAVMIAYACPRGGYGMASEGIGLRLPALSSAVGRVLVSGLDDGHREDFLDHVDIKTVTPYTVTERAHLQKLLMDVMNERYALVDQEAELGFRSLAVPLYRHNGQMVAALNVGLRVELATLKEMKKKFLPRLKEVSALIQEQLV
ncbi:helix-turn-helix domain-containing protein [Acetobacter tropicalis]|uniref:IclR family transcriptional regulator domain-containing protein n=1 Tax=Acetobacter tropicalis TaxID=104102 RepID=UPI000556775D|nr:IclR family transcriptional regulator C-terminal domain-containing protein [Acetobacter tropicalis]KAA8384237.1 helix-turn-helix domain-containing protein [Acetobacter tropicalis]KAA8391340.1 helix-turn-helix domain-containing protein [Acetobacter tropicalis]MBC9009241.1 helix-turn-helix domain-containing protein [Acetobacter tropicalis]MDO8172401.1 IclR family transcriptional regulator C-terminal domain-containing protein [Acetobacter tropicalis]